MQLIIIYIYQSMTLYCLYLVEIWDIFKLTQESVLAKTQYFFFLRLPYAPSGSFLEENCKILPHGSWWETVSQLEHTFLKCSVFVFFLPPPSLSPSLCRHSYWTSRGFNSPVARNRLRSGTSSVPTESKTQAWLLRQCDFNSTKYAPLFRGQHKRVCAPAVMRC